MSELRPCPWKILSSPTITVRLVKPPADINSPSSSLRATSPSTTTTDSASPDPSTKKRKLSTETVEEDNRPETDVLATYTTHVSALTEQSEYFAMLMSFKGQEVTDNRVDIELQELDCPFYDMDGWKYAILAFRCFLDFTYSGTFNVTDHLGSGPNKDKEEWNHVFLLNTAVYLLADRLLAKKLKLLAISRMADNLRGLSVLRTAAKIGDWDREYEMPGAVPEYMERGCTYMESFGLEVASPWMNGLKWVFDGTIDSREITAIGKGREAVGEDELKESVVEVGKAVEEDHIVESTVEGHDIEHKEPENEIPGDETGSSEDGINANVVKGHSKNENGNESEHEDLDSGLQMNSDEDEDLNPDLQMGGYNDMDDYVYSESDEDELLPDLFADSDSDDEEAVMANTNDDMDSDEDEPEESTEELQRRKASVTEEENKRRWEEALLGREPMRKILAAALVCFWELTATGDKGDRTLRSQLLQCIPELQSLMEAYREVIDSRRYPKQTWAQTFYRNLEEFHEDEYSLRYNKLFKESEDKT
ncbi:hypothetical protein BJ508DRAFT_348975 [Ascobolus immersus RN42]|uniref:BTB domain-containing protein n=1 Tax=Ascobolus immersus RN42 TaxID=1160509 RepID=A0A3N4I0C0_ASCIM|nr:hypothetical protein BJ508DRAFT_348975 [Ascobolus immersus RN42]